jgi:hypothetical protein
LWSEYVIPVAIPMGTLYDIDRAFTKRANDYPHPDYDYSTDDYNDFEYQQDNAEQIIINGDYG